MSKINPAEFKERIQQRMDALRARSPFNKGERILGNRMGNRAGTGAMINKARNRMDTITARIQERKPNIIPKVNEFKPGSRIKQILSPQDAMTPTPDTDQSLLEKSNRRTHSQLSVEI